MSPPSIEEVLIIGEVLRLKMHKDPSLIKDRRYHLRNYACCFIGHEVVEWLVRNSEVTSVANALACLRLLQESGIIHHVCDDHIVKSEYLFYRFRIDDGTFFVDTEYRFYHQAIMIHQRILGDSENPLMEMRLSTDEIKSEKCFVASSFVSWLVLNDIVRDRYAGQILGQQFLDILVIRPVISDSTDFFDDETLYRFIFDIEWESPLHRLLKLSDDDKARSMMNAFKKFTINDTDKKYLSKFWKGFTDDNKPFDVSLEKSDDFTKHDDEFLPTLQPVVVREVTVQELLNKESPYYWKNIRITSDLVGYGFIIRGNGPCYVQAVDPTGPAAAAGLKVRMYIYSVNGKIVLDMQHKEVAKEIMKGIVVDLVALQHFRSSH